MLNRWPVLLVFAFVLYSHSSLAQSVRVIEWNRGKSTVALLFLHGLGGCAVPNGQSASGACASGASDSFKNARAAKSWPQMLASDERAVSTYSAEHLKLEDLGIWGVDYSRLTVANCPNFSIPEAARLIRTQIETSEFANRYENFIIVAHSMGGLIAKNMLLQWHTAGDPEHLLARTLAVVLLGVPSQGSPVAPSSPAARYLAQTLHLDLLANVCARQVKDIFTGDENTYLVDLERNWEALLESRREFSHSLAPMVFCAYETKPEPLMGGVLDLTIVQRLYTQTQCSDSQFPIPTYHTALPKPSGPNDDVQAWLLASLRHLFRERSKWPFVTFTFLADDNFSTLSAYVNSQQNAFHLDATEVATRKPGVKSFKAPDEYALVSAIASSDQNVCLEANWNASQPKLRLRPAGSCTY